jgi:hypothetical protein
LLFKTGQADAMTAAFAEYSAAVMKRARDKRPPVMDEVKKAKEKVNRAEREKPAVPKKTRRKEVTRE